MSPDGAPKLEPVRELPPDPPRLCNAGPCRHYHQMKIQLDAQNPVDERKPDGTVVHHGRVFHVQTHHYCYPDVGIETNLGALPVLECNRWVPLTSLFRTRRGVRRRFERELAAFHTEMQSWQPKAVETGRDPGMVAKQYTLLVGVRESPTAPIVRGPFVITAAGKTEIHWLAEEAFTHFALNPGDFEIAIVASFDTRDLEPPGYVEPVTNKRATVDQLELVEGERILVTITKETP